MYVLYFIYTICLKEFQKNIWSKKNKKNIKFKLSFLELMSRAHRFCLNGCSFSNVSYLLFFLIDIYPILKKSSKVLCEVMWPAIQPRSELHSIAPGKTQGAKLVWMVAKELWIASMVVRWVMWTTGTVAMVPEAFIHSAPFWFGIQSKKHPVATDLHASITEQGRSDLVIAHHCHHCLCTCAAPPTTPRSWDCDKASCRTMWSTEPIWKFIGKNKKRKD